MNNQFDAIIEKLLEHTLDGIPKEDNQVHPFYEGYSITNIPAALCRWLDCPAPAGLPLADEIISGLNKTYSHVIFLVVDGLGLDFPAISSH